MTRSSDPTLSEPATMKTPFLPDQEGSSMQSYQTVDHVVNSRADSDEDDHAPAVCDKYFLRHLALSFVVNSILIFTWAFASKPGASPWFVYPVAMLLYLLLLHYFLVVRNTSRSRVTLHFLLLLCWGAMYTAPWLHLDRADAEFPWFVFPITIGTLPLVAHYCKVFHPGNDALIHLGFYVIISMLILVLFAFHGQGVTYFILPLILWGALVAYQFYEQRRSYARLRSVYVEYLRHHDKPLTGDSEEPVSGAEDPTARLNNV